MMIKNAKVYQCLKELKLELILEGLIQYAVFVFKDTLKSFFPSNKIISKISVFSPMVSHYFLSLLENKTRKSL